jgi:hypothetical protein
MASYLVLTPPGAAADKAERTAFLRDGFSLVAFLFPTLWLLWHRLWLHAAAAFVLQGIGGELMRRDGLWPAGFAVLFGVSLLAALEGRNLNARRLANQGWTEEGVLVAGRRDEAEDTYFANMPAETVDDATAVEWNIPVDRKRPPSGGGPALGLIGYDGGL